MHGDWTPEDPSVGPWGQQEEIKAWVRSGRGSGKEGFCNPFQYSSPPFPARLLTALALDRLEASLGSDGGSKEDSRLPLHT